MAPKKKKPAPKRKGKKIKAAKRAAPPPASMSQEPAPINLSKLATDPSGFVAVRDVTLPELWCRIDVPVRVQFLEKLRGDEPGPAPMRKRPACLARVLDLDEKPAQKKDLALPLALATIFASVPKDGYIGRCYSITRHRRHERKNAAGFSVVEISPSDSGVPGGDSRN